MFNLWKDIILIIINVVLTVDVIISLSGKAILSVLIVVL